MKVGGTDGVHRRWVSVEGIIAAAEARLIRRGEGRPVVLGTRIGHRGEMPGDLGHAGSSILVMPATVEVLAIARVLDTVAIHAIRKILLIRPLRFRGTHGWPICNRILGIAAVAWAALERGRCPDMPSPVFPTVHPVL